MTSQSFSLIFLIALFPTAFSGVTLDRFFPYGTTHGDTDMERGDDTGSPALQLSVPFPFFDTFYSTLWVNVNGAISFAKQISTYTLVCAPIEREYSSIAPFWADIDITYTGHVFYRQSTFAESLEKAQEEISSAFPNFAGIKLKWLLVSTWLNVTDHPDCYHCAQKRNTFQATITTDGRHSFAIFYYQNLTWTTGHADGGIDGLGGTPAQAGFDFGDGNHRMMIPGSCTGDVLKINQQSNVGDPGKWVFRVDRAAIQTAGCTQESETVQLHISPSFVYTITRQPIELVGPCVENAGKGTIAFCRFFDPNGNMTEFIAQIHVNGSSYAKFTCPTPFFYTAGRLRVKLHVYSGQPLKAQSYDSYFYTVDPHFHLNGNQLKVELETENKIQANSANKSSKILKFSWDPKLFPENQKLIQIGLLGLTSGKNQSWNELFPLVLFEQNKGVARVDAAKVAKIQEKFNNTEVIKKFAVMSQLAFYAAPVVFSSDSYRQRRVTKLIVPFLSLTSQRFFNISSAIISTTNTTAIANKFFTTETRQRLCQEWHNKDPGTRSFTFPACPCTSEQADNDADFEDDPAFGLFSFTSIFHPEADHCIRSKRKYGARGRQQCCYNKGGKLLAGTPGSGNEDWGFHGDRGFVSNFGSYWNTYMTTWYYCCWDDLSTPYCKKYYEDRSSKDCQNYRPKRKAAVIGDPHMRTFDGLSYTFNGAGEFWLLINSTDQPLSLQGRMEKTGTGSVVTALAMKTQKSSLVQIQYSRVRVVDIFVDQIPMDLSQEETLSVEFNNVSVSVTNALDRVYVSFSDGHTLELRTGFGFGLSLSVPTDFEDKTKGLFGTLDDNLTNDLRARNGSLMLSDASLEHIHNLFGLTWKIYEEESLFDYFDKDYLYYNPKDKEFHPNFNFDPSESSAAARELCGDNWACLYDFDSTGGNTEMANRTRQQVEAHETWRQVSNTAKVPSMCLPFNQPKNGYCLTSHFFEGAETQCHCFPGFEFPRSNNGDEIKNKSVETLRCQSSDAESVSWIPEKVADCEPTKPDEKCEVEERLDKSDIVVFPTQISMTDEYDFHDGNATFHFYCAARGKNVQVFFTRSDDYLDNDRYLGNATEEDITRSEIEQIFDKEFVRSSTCISAKRLTIPYTNAESAGVYICYAKRNFFDFSGKEIRLKLERTGGMCHVGSEFLCNDGRQCISINQACTGWYNEDCEDGSDEESWHGCLKPDIVNVTPEVKRLEIPEGGSISFSCRAVGIGKFFPDPYIVWRINETEINCAAPDCHQVLENGASILTLKNIKRHNEGQYYCYVEVAMVDHRLETRSSSTLPWSVHVVDKQPGDIEMAANPDEEWEEQEELSSHDVMVVPKQISITDEYGFHEGNNTVHFFCAAGGKDTQIFFSRRYQTGKEDLFINATEKVMTFSEIEQIFDRSFVNSSICITAKRLTIPFTNVKSAGLYACYAKNSYGYTYETVRLKLERSGGMCHFESEFRCADGRQCISKEQVCNHGSECADYSDEGDFCQPVVVNMIPNEVNLDIPENDSLNLTCQAKSNYSVPSIEWRVNGTEISCDIPDCQQVSEWGTGTLTLKNVKREYEGIYTCEAIAGGKRTVSNRDWIVRVTDRMTYG